MMTFLLATAIAGLISGILGYVSFDKILYQTMRSGSSGKKIIYVVTLVCVFAFGTAMTVLGIFVGFDSWLLIVSSLLAILFLFSVPGLILVFMIYVLLGAGDIEKVSSLIEEAATPLIGLVTGVVVAIGVSTPEFSGMISVGVNVFKMLIGGFIGAIIARITKSILSSIW